MKFEPQGKYLTIFSLGFMSLSLVGYYARDWHDMQVKLILFFSLIQDSTREFNWNI